MPKKFLIFLVIFFFLVDFGLFFYLHLRKIRQNIPEKKFIWGVATNYFVLNKPEDPFQPQNIPKQIEYLKKLGVNFVKIKLELKDSGFTKENEIFVDKLIENNLGIFMVLEAPVVDFTKEASYQKAYDFGYKVAKTFKGRVSYYQLLNEVNGMAIKPSHPGDKMSDYDLDKYKAVKNWELGLSSGIKKGDPEAKRVISANWLGTAIIEQLIKDGVEFEIVGWDWYSDMRGDPTHHILDTGRVYNIPKYFQKYHKEFWIVEANRVKGDISEKPGENGENLQAEYLKKLLNNIYNSGEVDGFFFFRLSDEHSFEKRNPNEMWGLLTNKENPKTGKLEFDRPKEAFYVFREFIQKYPFKKYNEPSSLEKLALKLFPKNE